MGWLLKLGQGLGESWMGVLCGSVPLSRDNGPDEMGILTVDFVLTDIVDGVNQFLTWVGLLESLIRGLFIRKNPTSYHANETRSDLGALAHIPGFGIFNTA